MKFQYIKSLAFVGSVILATSCTENSWNDTFLDGFDSQPTYDTQVTVSYQLTTTDYETIGKALYNMSETDEQKAAANAIQSNHYFDQNSVWPAQTAVPILLNQEKTDFYIYNEGSTVEVSLLQAQTPAEITAINAAPRMILETAPAASTIPSTLLNAYPYAQEGDYAIVSYPGTTTRTAKSAASSAPKATKKATRADAYWTVAQALSQMAGGFTGEATVKGIISDIKEISTSYGNATYTIKDNLSDTEGLLVYRGYSYDGERFKSEDEISVGQTVYVSGTLVDYNGTFEFTTGSKILTDEPSGNPGGDNPGGDNPGGDNTGSDDLTSNIKNLTVGGTLTATAVVTAQCTRGLVLTDNAGSILYYNTAVNLSSYPIGTIVNVSGEISDYNHGFQLSNTATITTAGNMTYTYPTPTAYDGEMVTQACGGSADILATYVTIDGMVTFSGNYTNIAIQGTSITGSAYYITDELKNQITDGGTYRLYGYFTSFSTSFFYIVVTKVEAITPAIDESTLVNSIYKFNGAEWAIATDAVVMNPSDYAALGQTNNKLTDPAIYLPIYMKNTYPYTAAGTEYYVAYNIGDKTSACALMEYDGANWTYVDNFIENKVAAFVKSSGKYSFRKYIGEEVFTLYEGDKIALNCSYMIVYGGYAMEPVPTGKTYGYPGQTEITVVDNRIVMPNGDNSFTFTTTTEYNGNVYTAPEGMFMILDSNGRYMYLQGTYSSFNVRAGNAYIENDGTINPGYLFTATKESDGTWRIVNTQDIVRTLYYSDGNNDFAAYTTEQLDRYVGRLPLLFISETSTPVADDSNGGEE